MALWGKRPSYAFGEALLSVCLLAVPFGENRLPGSVVQQATPCPNTPTSNLHCMCQSHRSRVITRRRKIYFRPETSIHGSPLACWRFGRPVSSNMGINISNNDDGDERWHASTVFVDDFQEDKQILSSRKSDSALCRRLRPRTCFEQFLQSMCMAGSGTLSMTVSCCLHHRHQAPYTLPQTIQ